MAIKENALPLGISSGSGSYIRTVSSGGESQRTPFDVVKGAMNADIETALENEVSAREDADTALRGEITDAVAAEATARDQAIAEAIATEVTDRNAAIAEAQDETEQAISTAISGEVTARNQAIASAIQTETADRTAAIQEAIADEVADRNAAIESAIDDEETARNTAISESVAAEAQAREAADEELNQSKANTDGNYPDMTVGNAGQLISSIYTEDQTPYNFRQSGGGLSIGDLEIDKIVGGTVAWNQLVQNGNFASTDGWGKGESVDSFSVSNGVATINARAATDNTFLLKVNGTVSYTASHKYLFLFKIKEATHDASNRGYIASGNTYFQSVFLSLADGWNNLGTVVNALATGMTYLQIGIRNTSVQSAFAYDMKDVMRIDLTAMYGTTIADYIYSLEQANAGSGITKLREWGFFRDSYYAYDAGSLQSVCVGAHSTTGKNLLNVSQGEGAVNGTVWTNNNGVLTVTGTVSSTVYRIIGSFKTEKGVQYTLTGCPTGGGANKYRITMGGYGYDYGNGYTFTGDGESHYVSCDVYTGQTLPLTFKPMIRFSSADATFEPYQKHTYALDSTKTLRGIPKLDASNNLYYDGDEYESTGKVTRRFLTVDLGSLDWIYDTLQVSPRFFASLAVRGARKSSYWNYDILTSAGYTVGDNIGQVANRDKLIGLVSYSQGLYLEDHSYTSASELKTALSGKYLVYELATPTTETADPYTNPQTVSNWGTEEYVDAAVQEGDRDVAVPVGHVTDYLANLRDKLQNLPDAANADGTYLVQQTSGQMALLAYTPGVNVPAAPTTDGTYTLQAVVSGGVATYSWVSS